MYIVLDNFITIMFMFIFDPCFDGLFDLVNPHVGSILVVAGKDSFVISFLFDDKTVPFFLQKP